MFNRIKHIRNKISIGILGCSFLMVIMLTIISAGVISSTIKQSAEENLIWMARYYTKEFSNDFLAIEDKVQQLEVLIQSTIDVEAMRRDRDAYLHQYEISLGSHVKEFADKRTQSIAGWVYFDPKWSDAPHDIYYVDGDGDGLSERQTHIPLAYYDKTPTPTDDKEWWYGPVRTGKGFWTNPYEWTLRNGEMIKVTSYAKPVYVNGEFICVVGTYFRFTRMANATRTIRTYENGFASLYNEKLDVIVHPTFFAGTRFTSDNLESLHDGKFKELAQIVKRSPYGIIPYEYNGEERLLAFSKLSNGWVLGINPPVNEVYGALYTLLYKTMAAVALCMLVSAVVACVISRSITRPIVTVIESAKAMGAGDFSTHTKVETCDEVLTLANSLNAMADAMHAMTQRLKQSYERMRNVVEGAGMFTWDYDLITRTLVHNAQWCRAVAYPGPAEDGVKPIDWLIERLHPDDLHHLEALEGVLDKGTFVHFDLRLLMPSGEWHWFRMMGRVEECDKDNKILRVAGTGFDVHAQKIVALSETELRAELEVLVAKRTQELVESRNQAQAASEAKTRFLSTVSHEIRTPMNAIVGFSHIFDRSNLTVLQVEYLDKIKLSAGALLNVINDVLDISKIEAGKLELESTPFHLAALIDTVISIVDFAARDKGLALSVEMDPYTDRAFEGDAKRISQILLNLLNNAVKFTAEGSIVVQVTSDKVPDENGLVCLAFSITDTGIGLSQEQQGHLFQPFSQADSSVSRKFGGTGLGLAICKQIVELMSGSIGVESVEGHGSRFFFTLWLTPAENSAPIDFLQQRMDAEKENEDSSLEDACILLVEDNLINQEIAKAILEDMGVRVEVADNGAIALKMLAEKRYDLIFMDLQMPVMDGLEATTRIREMGQSEDETLHWLAAVPIVAMTANTMREDRQRCMEVGMNDHIGKPIDPTALRKGLGLWLRG